MYLLVKSYGRQLMTAVLHLLLERGGTSSWHAGPVQVFWSDAEDATAVADATFGHWLTKRLQFHNEARNSFCIDRFSSLLPNRGFYAVRQRKGVRTGLLQSLVNSDTGDRSEVICSNLRNWGRGGIEQIFLVEALILRSHKS